VWVADALANAVSRIDPTLNAVTATIRVGRRPTRLAVGEGAVWVLNAGDGTVARIDPRRNEVVRTIRVGRHATGIAAGLGSVWVTLGGGPPRATTSSAAGRVRPLPRSGCSPVLQGAGVPELLVVPDLPTFVDPGAPSFFVADMRAAIRLVLRQRGFRAGRYRIAYQACDYSRPNEGPAPDRCAANARAYALDRSLIGVIGSYNSFCSGIELPTLNAAPGGPVPMVSPSNTYVGLTHTGPATAADEPNRHYPTGARNYLRLVAADDYQSAGAVLFLKQLGRKRLYLLSDGEGTGYAGAVYAAAAARKLGLAISGSAAWNASARSYRLPARRVARSGADAVLLSGCICSNGRKLVMDLRSVLGATATLIGTDNFSTTRGFRHARGAFDGLYISTAGLPAAALPARGKRFLAQLAPGRPLYDVAEYAAYAAQAAETLLDAIARSNGTRASVISELLASKVGKGIVGGVSFDTNGDPARAPIAIYRVDSHAPSEPHRGVQGLVLDRVLEPARSLVE
jgi:branched-chain amino acid transport system substrate-binding protein